MLMNYCIGVTLNDEMRDAISVIQDCLRKEGKEGHYVMSRDMHMKIADIGEYDDPNKIKDALKSLKFKPFEISLSDMGKRWDHWWVEVDKNKPLQSLAMNVRRDLAVNHIPFDRRRFLSRVSAFNQNEPDDLKVPAYIKRHLGARMTVDRLSLMCIDVRGHIAVYDEIKCSKAKTKN